MKNLILICFIAAAELVVAQANFQGNVYEMKSKNSLNNVKLMVVEESDTTYVVPDEKGNFDFKTKPGRVKVFAIADGYISELNSVNAGDGSKNVLNIGLVEEKMIAEMEVRGARSHVSKSVSVLDSHSELSEITIRSGGSETATYSWRTDSVESLKDDIGDLGGGTNTLKVGVLTAGEVNDFAKWGLWNDLNKNEFAAYSGIWKSNKKERFCIQLTLPSGMPVIDAEVQLTDASGAIIWSARTDNTGKAELWDANFDQANLNKYAINTTKGDFNA